VGLLTLATELGLYGSEVTPATFPLPTLGPKLYELADDIHSGKGFAAIRGLNPENLCPEDNVIIFLGVSSYIGSQRGRQDEDGNMLSECFLSCIIIQGDMSNVRPVHIRDAKSSTTAQEDRPIRYSRRASVSRPWTQRFEKGAILTRGRIEIPHGRFLRHPGTTSHRSRI